MTPGVRLVPPPRPGGPGSRAPHDGGAGRKAPWAALLGLGLVAAAAAAVVVVLPRWTSAPGAPASAPPAPPATTPAAGPALPLEAPPPGSSFPTAGNDGAAEHTPTPPARRPAPRPEPEAAPAPDTAFADAMSAGLAALDRGSWAEAKAAFARAAAANPGAPEAADGLARAEAGERLAAIAAHRERAAQLEAKEEWRAALAEHQAALALDPALAFALDGRARSEALANLHESLAAYAARPERLGADEVAREAARELDRAREVAHPGPRLQARIVALERALASARVPVRVVIRSDGQTAVTILRVGPLGAFEEKALELRPGTYAVTGSRDGFRDVRRTLVVEPGKPPAPLDVRCGEKL